MTGPLSEYGHHPSNRNVPTLPNLPFWWPYRNDPRYNQQYRELLRVQRRCKTQNARNNPYRSQRTTGNRQQCVTQNPLGDVHGCNIDSNSCPYQIPISHPPQEKGKFLRCLSRRVNASHLLPECCSEQYRADDNFPREHPCAWVEQNLLQSYSYCCEDRYGQDWCSYKLPHHNSPAHTGVHEYQDQSICKSRQSSEIYDHEFGSEQSESVCDEWETACSCNYCPHWQTQGMIDIAEQAYIPSKTDELPRRPSYVRERPDSENDLNEY